MSIAKDHLEKEAARYDELYWDKYEVVVRLRKDKEEILRQLDYAERELRGYDEQRKMYEQMYNDVVAIITDDHTNDIK